MLSQPILSRLCLPLHQSPIWFPAEGTILVRMPYKDTALTVELAGNILVGVLRFELKTSRLKAAYSTVELHSRLSEYCKLAPTYGNIFYRSFCLRMDAIFHVFMRLFRVYTGIGCGGKDLNLWSSAYEADELTTALPRIIRIS